MMISNYAGDLVLNTNFISMIYFSINEVKENLYEVSIFALSEGEKDLLIAFEVIDNSKKEARGVAKDFLIEIKDSINKGLGNIYPDLEIFGCLEVKE